METPVTPSKISIDDFRKIELKVATIKAAEAHPNADKLLVLQVDLGGEQRQICAGIRNQYTPEELIGKQIVVATVEFRTATLKTWIFTYVHSRLHFETAAGASSNIAFPRGGPFDQRRGSSKIPEIQSRLEGSRYSVAEQARPTTELAWLIRRGISPPFREPAAAARRRSTFATSPAADSMASGNSG